MFDIEVNQVLEGPNLALCEVLEIGRKVGLNRPLSKFSEPSPLNFTFRGLTRNNFFTVLAIDVELVNRDEVDIVYKPFCRKFDDAVGLTYLPALPSGYKHLPESGGC